MKKVGSILILCGLISAAVFAQGGRPYKIDLNQMPSVSYDKKATYDKVTQTITYKTEGACIDIWLNSLDISSYNIIRVKYRTPDNYGFLLETGYKDNSIRFEDKIVYCPSYLTEMVIPILENQKTLDSILFHSAWHVPSERIVLESVTLERVSNPELTDVRANTRNEPAVIDTAIKGSINEKLSAWNFVKQLGVGFQYYPFAADDLQQPAFGLDCCLPWNFDKPSKKTIQFIKSKGFKTIRLQTTPGGGHILDENYTIDPGFIKAIKQVVDWAIEEDMYVILCGQWNDIMSDPQWIKAIDENVHYAGYTVSKNDKKVAEAFLTAMWKQYALAFNNSYDEHLIFESLNEPTDRLHEHTFNEQTSCAVCKQDFAIFNEYNQLIVDTIRSTGGNNANRFIMVDGLGSRWQNITNNLFKLPKDKVKNKLIPTIHNYPMGAPPYHQNSYTKGIKRSSIMDCFDALDKYYFKKKIPVYISETGHSNFTPIMERISCIKDFMAEVNKNGRSCAVTLHVTPAGSDFDYYDTFKLEWYDTEYLDTVIYAADNKEYPLSADFIKKNENRRESITGKNLLKEPLDKKDWGNDFKLSSDLFCRVTPPEYKLVFEIEKTGADAVLRLAYEDMNGPWYELPKVSGIKIKGAVLKDGWLLSVKDNIVELSIDEKLAEIISEYSRGIYINGQNIIIKSVKVVE